VLIYLIVHLAIVPKTIYKPVAGPCEKQHSINLISLREKYYLTDGEMKNVRDDRLWHIAAGITMGAK
jgi:hypothetical protein